MLILKAIDQIEFVRQLKNSDSATGVNESKFVSAILEKTEIKTLSGKLKRFAKDGKL